MIVADPKCLLQPLNALPAVVGCVSNWKKPWLKLLEILPPTLWLDRRRPELVFGLLIALVLPEDGGSSILNRPNVDLR